MILSPLITEFINQIPPINHLTYQFYSYFFEFFFHYQRLSFLAIQLKSKKK